MGALLQEVGTERSDFGAFKSSFGVERMGPFGFLGFGVMGFGLRVLGLGLQIY